MPRHDWWRSWCRSAWLRPSPSARLVVSCLAAFLVAFLLGRAMRLITSGSMTSKAASDASILHAGKKLSLSNGRDAFDLQRKVCDAAGIDLGLPSRVDSRQDDQHQQHGKQPLPPVEGTSLATWQLLCKRVRDVLNQRRSPRQGSGSEPPMAHQAHQPLRTIRTPSRMTLCKLGQVAAVASEWTGLPPCLLFPEQEHLLESFLERTRPSASQGWMVRSTSNRTASVSSHLPPFVAQDAEEIRRIVQAQTSIDHAARSVQPLISPFLIGGHKFDLVLYVLVTAQVDTPMLSDSVAYLHNRGTVVFASQPFDQNAPRGGVQESWYVGDPKDVCHIEDDDEEANDAADTAGRKTTHQQQHHESTRRLRPGLGYRNCWSLARLSSRLYSLGISFDSVLHKAVQAIRYVLDMSHHDYASSSGPSLRSAGGGIPFSQDQPKTQRQPAATCGRLLRARFLLDETATPFLTSIQSVVDFDDRSSGNSSSDPHDHRLQQHQNSVPHAHMASKNPQAHAAPGAPPSSPSMQQRPTSSDLLLSRIGEDARLLCQSVPASVLATFDDLQVMAAVQQTGTASDARPELPLDNSITRDTDTLLSLVVQRIVGQSLLAAEKRHVSSGSKDQQHPSESAAATAAPFSEAAVWRTI